jgi:acyl carrier protein
MKTEADVHHRLERVLRETLEQPELTIHDGLQAKDVRGWDSLKHIMLILAIEEEFQIKFTTREVVGLRSVGQIVGRVLQKTTREELSGLAAPGL